MAEPLYTFLCAGCRSWSTAVPKSGLGRSAPTECLSCKCSDFRCRVESRPPAPSSAVAAAPDKPATIIVSETLSQPPPARKISVDVEAATDDERRSEDDDAKVKQRDPTASARKRRRDRRHRSASPSDAERLLASLGDDDNASVVELPHPTARQLAARPGVYEIESLGGSLVPVVADGVSTLACDIRPVQSLATEAAPSRPSSPSHSQPSSPNDASRGADVAASESDTRASLIPSHSMPTLEALSPWDRTVRNFTTRSSPPPQPSLLSAAFQPGSIGAWPSEAETNNAPPPRPLSRHLAAPPPPPVAPLTTLVSARRDETSIGRDGGSSSSNSSGEADIFADPLARLPSQFAWTLDILTS